MPYCQIIWELDDITGRTAVWRASLTCDGQPTSLEPVTVAAPVLDVPDPVSVECAEDILIEQARARMPEGVELWPAYPLPYPWYGRAWQAAGWLADMIGDVPEVWGRVHPDLEGALRACRDALQGGGPCEEVTTAVCLCRDGEGAGICAAWSGQDGEDGFLLVHLGGGLDGRMSVEGSDLDAVRVLRAAAGESSFVGAWVEAIRSAT